VTTDFALDQASGPARRATTRRERLLWRWLGTCAALGGCAAILPWITAIVSFRDQGLDGSDESFYLLMTDYARHGFPMTTEFGQFNRALAALTPGGLGGIRIGGVILLLSASVLTARAAVETMASVLPSRWHRINAGVAAAVAVSVGSMSYYGIWLTTPSYNLYVTSFTLLIAGMALRAVASPGDRARIGDIVGVGVVGAALFLVKPPSAVLVGVLVLGLFVSMRGLRWAARHTPVLAVAAGVALLTYSFVVAGGPSRLLSQFAEGNRALAATDRYGIGVLLNGGFLRLNGALLGVLVVLQLSSWLVIRRLPRMAPKRIASLIAFGLTATALFGVRPHGGFGPRSLGRTGMSPEAGTWWLAVGVATMLWTMTTTTKFSRSHLVGPWLLLVAIGSVFGSGNGAFAMVTTQAGLVVLAVIVHSATMLTPAGTPLARSADSLSSFTILAMALSLITSAIILQRNEAIASPYRQDPLTELHSEVSIPRWGLVRLSAVQADYVRALSGYAQQWSKSDVACVAVLSGTPLSALALDRRPMGSPWLDVSTAGWQAASRRLVERDPCPTEEVFVVERVPVIPGAASVVKSIEKIRVLGEVRYSADDQHRISIARFVVPSAGPARSNRSSPTKNGFAASGQ
jgi:hypothetical protein